MREEHLELEILEEFAKYQIPEKFYQLAVKALKDKTEVEDVERESVLESMNTQIATLNKREKNLLDMKLDDKIDGETFEMKHKEISSERTLLQNKLSTISKRTTDSYKRARITVELLKSPLAYWKLQSYERRGRLQKIIWSNFLIRDGKVQQYKENRLFELIKSQNIPSGWGRGIRTPECQYQKLVPYHLAIPQYFYLIHIIYL